MYVCLFWGVQVSGLVKSLSAGLSASLLVVGVVPCFSCCGTCRYTPVTHVIEFSSAEAVMFCGECVVVVVGGGGWGVSE